MRKGDKPVASAYIGSQPIDKTRLGNILAWLSIRSNYLTKEGFYIETADKLIFNSKD